MNRVQVELSANEIKWLRLAAWRFAQDVLEENAVVPEDEDPDLYAEAAEGARTLSTLAQRLGITQEEKESWTR